MEVRMDGPDAVSMADRVAPVSTDLEVLGGLLAWPGLDVVDVGCGAGALCRGLAAAGARVLGMEPDPAQAALNAAAPAPGVTFSDAPAGQIPRDAETVDVVIFNRSLHHVPVGHMDEALLDALRVLRRPAGVLFVLEPDIAGAWSQLLLPFHDETEVRRQALSALDRVAAPCFARSTESWFRTPVIFADFEAFVARMTASTYVDIDRKGIVSEQVRRTFASARRGDGHAFDNLVRLRGYAGPR